MAAHLLDIKTRPAGGCDRIAPKTEGVNADRKPRLFRGLVDRPVAPLAQRLDVAAQEQYLDKVLVAGAFPDFGGRRRAAPIGDHDGTLKARVLAGPFFDLPVVDRRADRRTQIMIADALPGVERIEHAEHDIVRIEMLL